MQILLQLKGGKLTDQLDRYVRRSLQFALDRFCERLSDVPVRVFLRDINGPHGGPDKHCRIRLHLLGRDLTVEALDATFTGSVDRAAERLSSLLSRTLERRRAIRRSQRNA